MTLRLLLILTTINVLLQHQPSSYAMIITNNKQDTQSAISSAYYHHHINENINNDKINKQPLLYTFPEMDAKGFHEYVFDDQVTDVYGRGKKGTRGGNKSGHYLLLTRSDAAGLLDLFQPLNKKNNGTSSLIDKFEDRQQKWMNGNNSNQWMSTMLQQITDDALPTTVNEQQYYQLENITPHRHHIHHNNNNIQDILLNNRITGMGLKNDAEFDWMLHKRNNNNNDNNYPTHTYFKQLDDAFGNNFDMLQKKIARMDSTGFHGDVFEHGFDRFETLRKRGSTRNIDNTLEKRALEMDSTGFYGDVFLGEFGDFDPLRKRSPEMDSTGFESDVFRGGFGSFNTLKKKSREMDSKGFHGDLFRDGFGKFDTLKKRKSNGIIGRTSTRRRILYRMD